MLFAWNDNKHKLITDERHELNELATYITSRVMRNYEEARPRDKFDVKFRRVRPAFILYFIDELFELMAKFDGYEFTVYRVNGDNEIRIAAHEELNYAYIPKLSIYMALRTHKK